MIIKECTTELLNEIKIQKGQIKDALMVEFGSIPAEMLSKYSLALEIRGSVVGAVGLFPLWEGVGAGWALFSEGAMDKHWLSISRAVKEMLDAEIKLRDYRRVETVVDVSFVRAQNWAEWLGFEIEGISRNYGNGGSGDFYRYARII